MVNYNQETEMFEVIIDSVVVYATTDETDAYMVLDDLI